MHETIGELKMKTETLIENELKRLKKRMDELVLDDFDLLPFSQNGVYFSTFGRSEGIIDVNIIVPDKVVEVAFINGDKQKAVCQDSDVFSLEQAISICLTKHLLGGSGAYNKVIKNGIKFYQDKLKEVYRIKIEEERVAKKRAKQVAYIKRRAKKRKEEQIEIQKEAYIRAMEYMNAKVD